MKRILKKPVLVGFGMAAIASLVLACAPAQPAESAESAGHHSILEAQTVNVAELTTEQQIENAMSAAPEAIAKDARIIRIDGPAKQVVLREGSNGFTCLPGDPNTEHPPVCANPAGMQWYADFEAHKPRPTNTTPGITYMLAGAAQRSDTDPYDKTSPLMKIAPHWMILWPFDPTTTGLPTVHKESGAHIMWAGTPYAHLHVLGQP